MIGNATFHQIKNERFRKPEHIKSVLLVAAHVLYISEK